MQGIFYYIVILLLILLGSRETFAQNLTLVDTSSQNQSNGDSLELENTKTTSFSLKKDDIVKHSKSFFQFNEFFLNSNFQYQSGVYSSQSNITSTFNCLGTFSYSLFGIPLQNSFFIVNQDGNFSQGINRLSFSFDKSRFEREKQKLYEEGVKTVDEKKNAHYKNIKDLKVKRDSLLFLLKNDSLKKSSKLEDSDTLLKVSNHIFTYNDSIRDQIVEKEKNIELLLAELENLKKLDSLKKIRQPSFKDIERYSKTKTPTMKRLLSNVKTFEVGVFMPKYSRLLLGGIPLKGLNVETQFNNIYIAVVKGTYSFSNAFQQSNKSLENRKIDGHQTMIRLGYGRTNANYLHFSYLFSDNTNYEENKIFFGGLEIKRNNVFHVDAKYSIGKYVYTKFEYSVSNISVNKVSGVLETNNSISIVSLDAPNKAYSIKLGTNLPKTKLELEATKIGNSYYSLGNPYLMKDNLMFKMTLSQFFWKRIIQLSSAIITTQDNLSNTKSYSTNINSFTLGSRVTYKKLPQVILSYSRNSSVGNWQELNLTNSSYNTQGTIGIIHSFSIKEVRCNAAFNHNIIDIKNNFSFGKMHTLVILNSLNTSVDFKKISIVNVFLLQSNSGIVNKRTSSFESLVSYRDKKISIGGLLGFSNDNIIGTKLSTGFNISSKLFKNNQVQLNFKKVYFERNALLGLENPITISLNLMQKF